MTRYDFFAFVGISILSLSLLYLIGLLGLKYCLTPNKQLMSDRDYRGLIGAKEYEEEEIIREVNNHNNSIVRLPKSHKLDNASSEELRAFYKTLPISKS
jgi:hypothetical protein